ncbi:hypothetical protein PA598K_01143 [Paenibacillus sp. 598K]|nr:hypothetical protein PA598K_01143 [Paenibacillus sp. 598K]
MTLNGLLLGLVLLLAAFIWFNRETLLPGTTKSSVASESADSGATAGQLDSAATDGAESSLPSTDPNDGEASGSSPQPEEQEPTDSEEPPVTDEPEPSAPDSSSSPTSPEPESESEAVAQEDAADDEVTLSFVGDILLAASVEKLMREHGWDYPYAEALSYLSDADLTAGNLENPITRRGTPAEDKQYVFKGAPESLPALRDAGFDIVGLANNHTLDMGVVGLMDTMEHLDTAGIPHVGAGNDDVEAFAPVVLEARGVKVAYLSVSRVLPVVAWKADSDREGVAETYDPSRAVRAIKAANEQADLVIVMVHWGKERVDRPLDYQRQLARDYVDAGADLVIGSHPHVLQGFEQYNGKWIAYSLGNFIFNMTATPATADTGVLDARCTRSGDCKLKLHPMRQVKSQPKPLVGEEAAALLQRISSISYGAVIDGEGNIYAKQ